MFMMSAHVSSVAECSAAPQSLRKSCSFLLAAMKSNQSPAFSPGLTSAFNYRTQQQQQHRERLPQLGHNQHVTALMQARVSTAGLCIQWPDINTVSVNIQSVLMDLVCFHIGCAEGDV